MKKKIGAKSMIFPMPALLVGTYGEDGTPNAMAAAWTAICCHKPPCAGVAIRQSRLTFENLTRKKAFTLNVPKTSQAAEVDYLGIVSGKKEPKKLAAAGMKTVKADKVDAPILVDCPVNLECRLVEQTALGSHTWFVGEILEVHVDEDVFGNGDAIDVSSLDPLVYITSVSEYYSLGNPVAKAYNVGKKFKKTDK
jgi:flavin reductase (DIM6/NTAB) family NADH-FMN oxidoreductase RutF